MENEFQEFSKIARLNRPCVITEKIDGTNAQILIADDFVTMTVGSRTRWITPENDNHGFAKWCETHREELLHLGPGRHFGEWWGQGIQRNYGLKEKRFSLFNTHRWNAENLHTMPVGVVPVLYEGPFRTDAVEQAVERLRREGSLAAPGFMKPEGVVVYHIHGAVGFKVTLEHDEIPKSLLDKQAQA
jgi:hypothetical protein